jgi:hypothetical protein
MTTTLNGYAPQGWGVYREKPTGISINDNPPRLPRHVERMLFRKMMFPPLGSSVNSNVQPLPRFRKRKLLKENPMSQMGAGRRRKRRPKRKVLGEFAQTIGFGKKTYGKRRRIYRKKR